MANPFSQAVFPKVLTNYSHWTAISSANDALLPPDTPSEKRRNYIERLAPDDINSMPKLMEALVADLIRKDRIEPFRIELFNLSAANPVLQRILSNQITVDDNGVADPDALQNMRNRVQPYLNVESFHKFVDAARYRVCAIWVDSPVAGKPTGIVGTGFLIAPDLVMTARHVVEDLLQQTSARDPQTGAVIFRDGVKPQSSDRLACLFDYWVSIAAFDINAPPRGIKTVPVVANTNWLVWSSRRHPSDGITHVFGPPPVNEALDCAVIRLARRVGASSAGAGGGRMRGWHRLNGPARLPQKGERLGILQHPAGGPQMVDLGDYEDSDPSPARIFYTTNASGGSSGSPCFNSEPNFIAFHNAGYPTAFRGTTEKCNQGVLINPVLDALRRARPELLQESQRPFKEDDTLWSLSDDPDLPEPILGRADFKEALLAMFDPGVSQRVMIVTEEPTDAAVGKTGKSFSVRILRAMARRRPATVVELDAKGIQPLKSAEFLGELGRLIGLGAMDGMPEHPTNERQLTRWWANDLPQWFGQLIEGRAKQAGTAITQAVSNAATGPAAGRELVARELIWISIDDIHKFPPEGGLKELIAGMIGATDTQDVIGPGLKALRWLLIGHVPDFVREHALQYKQDVVSRSNIGVEAWKACIRAALMSFGADEQRYDEIEKTAGLMFEFAKDRWTDEKDPVLALKTMANAAVDAIQILRRRYRNGEGG
jgi:hypothetical protein